MILPFVATGYTIRSTRDPGRLPAPGVIYCDTWTQEATYLSQLLGVVSIQAYLVARHVS